jgi:hypothetical protein
MKNSTSILRVLRTQLIRLIVSALLLSVAASATNVYVKCSGSADNDKAFHSINDALNTLDYM